MNNDLKVSSIVATTGQIITTDKQGEDHSTSLRKDDLAIFIGLILDQKNMCATRLVCHSWKRGVDQAIHNRLLSFCEAGVHVPINFKKCIQALVAQKGGDGTPALSPMGMLKSLTRYAFFTLGMQEQKGIACLRSADLQHVQDLYSQNLCHIWDSIKNELDFGEQIPPVTADEITAWLLDPKNKEELANIRVLDLSNLPIMSIPACVFNSLKNLVDVNLENTQIFSLPPQMKNLVLLETVNVRNTPMQEIPQFFDSFKGLKKLDVRDCLNLEVIPPSVLRNKNVELISNHVRYAGIKRTYGRCGEG